MLRVKTIKSVMEDKKMFNSGEYYKRSEIHDEYGGNKQRGTNKTNQSHLTKISR